MHYLGYCQGGHTTKAEGADRNADEDSEEFKPQRILRQFYVERELKEMGIDCWVPREIKFLRRGKKRRPEPIEGPYVENYIFIDIPVERFIEVLAIKYLGSPLMMLSRADIAALGEFRQRVESAYHEAQHAAQNQEAISEYVKGEKIRAVNGTFSDQFSDQVLTFIEMIERPHDVYPKVKASMEMMGRSVTLELDPLAVRAAE